MIIRFLHLLEPNEIIISDVYVLFTCHQVHLLVRLEAGGDVVDGEVGGVLAEVEHVHHHLLEGVVVFLRRAGLYLHV